MVKSLSADLHTRHGDINRLSADEDISTHTCILEVIWKSKYTGQRKLESVVALTARRP